jgi:CheY-like chemotaxis protein
MAAHKTENMETKKRVRKILLADDDADDRQYFRAAVNEIDASIEFIETKDGQETLELLQNMDASSLPDYIFLDLRMPRYSGKQCLLQIKGDERLKSIPIIIYTTSKEVEHAEQMQALGAVHFISKPNNPEEIYYVLSLVLEEEWDNDTFIGKS